MCENYRFKLGNFECTVVSDGHAFVTADLLFDRAPANTLKKQLSVYHLKPERILGPLNCLVVDTGDHLVLFDTGLGSFSTVLPIAREGGRLLRNLEAVGLEPGDFDIVILSHYHSDHIGAVSDQNGSPTFPRAKYYIWRTEWDFALNAHKKIKQKLLPIRKHVEFLDQDTEIAPGIKAISAPGHSPGHMILSIGSRGDEMLYISDLVTHLLHIEFPDWSMSHETDQDRAVNVRRAVLGKAVKEKTLIHGFHMDFPGLGHVVQNGKGWTWRPINS